MTTKNLTTAIALNARLAVSGVVYLLVNRYIAFLLGVFVYSLLINLLGGPGGVVLFKENVGFIFNREYLELTLLFYLYCYFNMILRPSRWQALLAVAPLFFAYLGQDIYYLMYSNIFRFTVLLEIPELLSVLSPAIILLLVITVVVPLGFFLWSIHYRNFVAIIVGILPLLLLIGAVKYYPERYITSFRAAGQEIVDWSDAVSAENNGRFMMVLYREAERKIAVAKTEAFRDRPRHEQQAQQMAGWIRTHSNNRNVHLVVLESFLDPTLFRSASLSQDPFHPSFKKLFGNKMGFSLSPVVGGGTSQAEFELLCGAPAFEELAGVEFNSFTGSQAYCLPGTLQLAGYQTMASNAYKPSFFNTPKGYKGMGFAKMYFPREYVNDSSSYLTIGDTSGEDGYMFDGTVFAENLEFIAPLIKDKTNPPLFNYVLTIYGHMPHILNEQKRPKILKMVSAFKDPHLEMSANQLFYRSEAVADYVNRLLEIDEKSLIILVSDHVPPGLFGRVSYEKMRYLNNKDDFIHMNRIMVIEDGKVKKLATIHHYDVPAMVLNYVTKGAYCKEQIQNCGFAENKFLDDRMKRHDDYMRVMAHATD
jgi:phosphoglycerol transferase MdoB-like AlkP superfamily enzyme